MNTPNGLSCPNATGHKGPEGSSGKRATMTPGPWEWIIFPGDRGRVKGKPLHRNLWNKSTRVAVLDADYIEFNGEGVWESWVRINDANARAIAAVPELIAVLERIVAHPYAPWGDYEADAKAALSKAGVTP